MAKRSVIGSVVVSASALVMVIGATSTAYAADRTQYWYDAPIYRGNIHFVDDGDRFIVTDSHADGYGVHGALYDVDRGEAVAWADDGGDVGSNSFTYNIKGTKKYKLSICWRGAPNGSSCRTSSAFSES